MTVTVSPKQAKELVIHALKSNVVPMLHGSPATSKSSIVKSIAEDANFDLIDLRLSQCDPTDLLGLPHFFNGRAAYNPFDIFPIEGDELPEGKSGWLLFLDEFNSCSRATQAAAYKITLDRMVGQHKLHPKVKVVLAGNLMTDNAIVNEMSTAMQSRLVHLEVQMNKEDWIEWAIDNEIDTRVITFIEYRPALLNKFDPDHNDKTYPCARTWEFTSRLIKGQNLERKILPLIQGTLGEGTGLEFYNFTQLKDELPSLKDVLDNPTETPVPEKSSHKYAMASLLTESFSPETSERLMEYVLRFPMEYQYLIIRMAIKTNNTLLSIPAIDDWVTTNAKRFYG